MSGRDVKFSKAKTSNARIRVACKKCGRGKNHVVLSSIEENGSVEAGFGDYHWHKSHQIIQCQGCDTVSFRVLSSNSEDVDSNYDVVEYEELYPSRTAGRSVMRTAGLLPDALERIYSETISALNGGQPVLAGIGIRAIVETVAKDRKATGRNLFGQIDSLVKLGVLTKDGADILHKLRVLGNRAAHEVKAHSPEELGLAVDVVEHLMKAVYILPHHASRTFK